MTSSTLLSTLRTENRELKTIPMQALIFDIKRFAVHDGPGIRMTVFFKGCHMSCWWCHNPEGINPEPEKYTKETVLDGKVIYEELVVGEWIGLEDLIKEIEKERIFIDQSGGGVTFSGGEPFLQAEFLINALKECKNRSIHTAIDTSGFTSEQMIRQAAGIGDMFLYDLKFIDEEEHIKYTGVSNKQIIRNLRILSELKSNVIIRIPVIPGINDKPHQIKKLIDFLNQLSGIENVDLLPYHFYARNKYQRFNRINKLEEIEKPSESHLANLKSQFENAGFKAKIEG
jgi:pyruvate formate lyase activating enzyme